MIDILVYLFETYGYADACPYEPEQLARKLSAAGFEEEDISDAIEWLTALRSSSNLEGTALEADKRSLRIFSDAEQARLDVRCRGFLLFLDGSRVLETRQRELIIERAMAIPDDELSLSKFKVIVLMVLWQDKANVDTLILDELLTDESDDNEDGDAGDSWGEAVSVH